jgi:hypothetical protein
VTCSVKADDLFWQAVDEVDDLDIIDEIHEICWTLAEECEVPGAEQDQTARLGPVVVPAWSVRLAGDEGFVVYVGPDVFKKQKVYLYRLVWTDWADL